MRIAGRMQYAPTGHHHNVIKTCVDTYVSDGGGCQKTSSAYYNKVVSIAITNSIAIIRH